MTTAMNSAAVTVQRKRLVLSDNEILIFDYKDGHYRMSHYIRGRRPESHGFVPAGVFDKLVRFSLLPRSSRDSWRRKYVVNKALDMALFHVLDSAQSDADPKAVYDYIRSTGWGSELP